MRVFLTSRNSRIHVMIVLLRIFIWNSYQNLMIDLFFSEVNKKNRSTLLLGRIMNLLPCKTTDDTWKHINMMILRELKWIYCTSCQIPAVWWPEKVTILVYTDNICINLSTQKTQIAYDILCNKWIGQHNRTSTRKTYVRICYGGT